MSGFAKEHVIRNGEEVYLVDPNAQRSLVRLAVAAVLPAKETTSYYYVRAEQKDGELVWVSPPVDPHAVGGSLTKPATKPAFDGAQAEVLD